MKRIIIITSVIALFSIGCQEEESITPIADNSAKEVLLNNKQGGGTINPYTRVLIWSSGPDGATISCPKAPKYQNCMDPVEITPSIASPMDDIFDDISTGNQTTIQAAFTAEEELLKSYLDNDIVDQVILGEIYVFAWFNTNENADRYMLFYNDLPNGELSQETAVLAAPFVD